MSEKKRFFRFLPLLGGIITLIISFIASIPLSSTLTLSFHVVEMENIYYYIWGVVENGVVWFDFSQISLDNLIPLVFWIFSLFSAICGIIGTFYTEKPTNIKKILLIAGFTLFIELTYYIIIYSMNFGSMSLGLGFYGLICTVLLYFISSLVMIDYQK